MHGTNVSLVSTSTWPWLWLCVCVGQGSSGCFPFMRSVPSLPSVRGVLKLGRPPEL